MGNAPPLPLERLVAGVTPAAHVEMPAGTEEQIEGKTRVDHLHGVVDERRKALERAG